MRARPNTLLVLLSLITTPALAAETWAETWIVRTDLWGNPAFSTLVIDTATARLTGTLDGDPFTGTATPKRLAFTATEAGGAITRYTATRTADRMTGSVDAPDTNNPAVRAAHSFTARRIPDRPAGAPRNVTFTPTDYSNTFNADRPPVLTIWPGETVHTSTIDSGGVDAAGVTRALFGNPQTGPFFVAGAVPGDTLVIRLNRLRLDRDYADSLDDIVGRARGTALAAADPAAVAALGKPVRWLLDRTTGRARPEKAAGALADLSIPIRPMLGGLAVAPGFGTPSMSTGDTGRFGGNMDFNQVVEGNTVYLPVQQPGALLYLGDAHAAQGDGETSQYALETSMQVGFTVDLIKGRAIAMPRVESPTQLMVLGQAGSLDDALKVASTGLIQWLQQDYGLTLSQAGQLAGAAIQYRVANLAGRSVGLAAIIDKALLPPRRAPARR